MAKRTRNAKGQFTKGHGAVRSHHTKTRTIVKYRSASPAKKAHHKPARRKRGFLGLGNFGGGFVGRLLPEQQDIEGGISGYALGWLVRGYKTGPGKGGEASLAYKITDALPKWWDGGGLIGNIAIAATFLSAVTRHPWARALKRAAITCTFYDYAKRDGAAPAADAVEGWPDGNGGPDNDVSGDPDDAPGGAVEGWVDPNAFGQQQAA